MSARWWARTGSAPSPGGIETIRWVASASAAATSADGALPSKTKARKPSRGECRGLLGRAHGAGDPFGLGLEPARQGAGAVAEAEDEEADAAHRSDGAVALDTLDMKGADREAVDPRALGGEISDREASDGQPADRHAADGERANRQRSDGERADRDGADGARRLRFECEAL